METLAIRPLVMYSLVPVSVLVGLFEYLRRYTGKAHFKTWTSGWLFYALFLALMAMPSSALPASLAAILKNFTIATGALLILWGNFQFIRVPARQRLIAMMVVFNLMWSCATADELPEGRWLDFPAFAFLAVSSGFTAFCFFSKRSGPGRRGAALLTLAFSLWSLFLLCSPFLRSSPRAFSIGLIAASVLQLFIAISMMILVLEETRGRLQTAVENFAKEVQQSSQFRSEAEIAQESYRLIFENTREAVVIVAEDDLEILDMNRAARKLFGLREGGSVGPLLAYCSLPNRANAEAPQFRAALVENPEVDLTLHNGAKVRARTRTQALRHGSRAARQILFTEVAERAQLGAQLRGGKLSGLGQIISGVAHELNNPLAAIKGYTDLLLLASNVDPQTRSALMKVSTESNRAARLVHNLLAFARPETPRIAPLAVNDLVRAFGDLRRQELQAKEITLELDLAPELPLVLASADQLQQVLAHLLNNASDAVEEEEPQDRIVRIRTDKVDDRIQVRVEDSGPGVAPEVLPRIFEPFFTTKPTGAGTGLGLSVCYSIILHHKGKIACQNSDLGGASFLVELPAALATAQPTNNIAVPDFRPKTANGGAKLLVVDDEPAVVSLLNDMLTLLGHHVTAHTSPYNALTELQAHEFDAILSDFRMPGMTGGDLYREAVALKPEYKERFLFLTGDTMDPRTNQFFASTQVPCLLKPFQLSALQCMLAEVLEKPHATPGAARVG